MGQKIAPEVQSVHESEVEKFVKELKAIEKQGVDSFGNFNLSYNSLYYSGTIIRHQEFFIASGKDGKIHIYSTKHKRTRTFKGAGGTKCL